MYMDKKFIVTIDHKSSSGGEPLVRNGNSFGDSVIIISLHGNNGSLLIRHSSNFSDYGTL